MIHDYPGIYTSNKRFLAKIYIYPTEFDDDHIYFLVRKNRQTGRSILWSSRINIGLRDLTWGAA